MRTSKGFSILGYAIILFFTSAQAFLDFEPEIINQSYENNGIMQQGQSWSPYGDGDQYSFCQQVFPGASYFHNAELSYGQVIEDVNTPFGSEYRDIVYCDAEIEGLGRRRGHFAMGPEGLPFALRQEGDIFYRSYDDDYYYY